MRIALITISTMMLLLISGCRGESPTIDEETYMKILAELELIYVFQTHTGEKERTAGLIKEVWSKYQVDEEEFLSSHFLYEKDTTDQIRRIRTITEKLTRKHQTLEDSLSVQYMEGDF